MCSVEVHTLGSSRSSLRPACEVQLMEGTRCPPHGNAHGRPLGSPGPFSEDPAVC